MDDDVLKAVARKLDDMVPEGDAADFASWCERALRDIGLGELLAKGQAMRDCNYINTANSKAWDAAKAKVLS